MRKHSTKLWAQHNRGLSHRSPPRTLRLIHAADSDHVHPCSSLSHLQRAHTLPTMMTSMSSMLSAMAPSAPLMEETCSVRRPDGSMRDSYLAGHGESLRGNVTPKRITRADNTTTSTMFAKLEIVRKGDSSNPVVPDPFEAVAVPQPAQVGPRTPCPGTYHVKADRRLQSGLPTHAKLSPAVGPLIHRAKTSSWRATRLPPSAARLRPPPGPEMCARTS